MSYEVFRSKINALIARAGKEIEVRFSSDEEKGVYYAHCSDGTRITGNSDCLKVTVRWGSGHCATAAI